MISGSSNHIYMCFATLFLQRLHVRDIRGNGHTVCYSWLFTYCYCYTIFVVVILNLILNVFVKINSMTFHYRNAFIHYFHTLNTMLHWFELIYELMIDDFVLHSQSKNLVELLPDIFKNTEMLY